MLAVVIWNAFVHPGCATNALGEVGTVVSVVEISPEMNTRELAKHTDEGAKNMSIDPQKP